jgi:hypothetical protein
MMWSLQDKMAKGVDGLLFTLTTTLIVARILAFPTPIILPDNDYMAEDLGLYSGTKPKPSCYNFSLDLFIPEDRLRKRSAIIQIDVTTNTYQTKIQQHIHQ